MQIGLAPFHDGDVIARTSKPKAWNPDWWRFEPLYTAAQPATEKYTALEQALTRLQKRYGELEAKVAAQPAQLAPVQVLQRYSPDGEGGMEVDSLGVYVKHQDVSNPPAQPAVPDAITDSGEDPKYRAGWNECRETMLEMMKARTL